LDERLTGKRNAGWLSDCDFFAEHGY
jgi:hypothetical protein